MNDCLQMCLLTQCLMSWPGADTTELHTAGKSVCLLTECLTSQPGADTTELHTAGQAHQVFRSSTLQLPEKSLQSHLPHHLKQVGANSPTGPLTHPYSLVHRTLSIEMGVKVGKRVKREKKCSCKTGDHYFQEILRASYGRKSASGGTEVRE